MNGEGDALDTVDAAQGAGRMSIADAAVAEAREVERMRGVEGAFDAALGSALVPPGAAAPTTAARDAVSGAAGEVGEIKAALLSGVEREGTASAEEGASSSLDGITEQFKALYTEMTTWQIAWSMAQQTQKDVNHLLRGQ